MTVIRTSASDPQTTNRAVSTDEDKQDFDLSNSTLREVHVFY